MRADLATGVNPERSWTRLDGVDLLRGLAIFLVLMNHVNMRLRFAHVPYTKGLPDQLVSSLVWNGQRGVQIFFAVSGFLITSTALRRWGSLSAVSIVDFYRLRFARIAPLLLLLLAVLSALHFAQLPNFVVSAKTGGLGTRACRGAHLSCECFGGTARISSRKLGHPVVALRRRDVLPFLSARLPAARQGKATGSASAGICRTWPIRANRVDPWQPGLA